MFLPGFCAHLIILLPPLSSHSFHPFHPCRSSSSPLASFLFFHPSEFSFLPPFVYAQRSQAIYLPRLVVWQYRSTTDQKLWTVYYLESQLDTR
ncbi:hypothetical protein M413DRAFT_449858 [Hebeloma cylindrosporum]|uniref:Secreted protein n=1 Tax=Hebeloma cylindrosporum TaxID=76867 RepID=A0A0C3BT51_HEBCY|nr:hypothetical protein M413DRAFT_449858 [Hebeloma cylindrosporum h7]